ncbi:MAG TPA: hypothetical protein VJS38_04090 [Phenylobacterium sp.]|uniref:bestrophin-like domain n=1 Tax=Phenylobacterium sp. TaxID=1871053 RepID=UPI002B4A0F95|nr:hypothetical protein [Phenylobacterium sp.]HKR87331.1 hypothetical protein [Phenylobacterium sp.]
MMLAAAIGRAARARWTAEGSAKAGEEKDAQEDLVLSASLGLLALLLGFTFSLAIDRFESRRRLVLEEANAIGTAYLRAQLLEEPHRARMSGLLVRYTDTRIALAKAPPGKVRDLLRTNDALVTQIWIAVKQSFPTIKQYDFSSTYLDSINSMIDIGSARVVARVARVPSAVLAVLLLYTLTTAAVLGYVLQGPRSRHVAGFLVALLSLVLVLIIDVNRPSAGLVREGQGAMESLRKTMDTWRPATFDAPAPR